MVSYAKSACINGVKSNIIETQTDINNGLPIFELVGLSGQVANESRERVRSAIRNSGYDFPMKRIVVNLSPAEMRKEGSQFDLAIAIGILAAANQINISYEIINKFIYIGELSLDGRVNPVKGVLPIVIEAVKNNFEGVIIPVENVTEALTVEGIRIIAVDSLYSAIDFTENTNIQDYDVKDKRKLNISNQNIKEDFADIKGQRSAKRALEIAAAGNHNCIMMGSPGSGKSMLAKCLPGILPEMTAKEAMETNVIYSIAGMINEREEFINKRPFRSPHHNISTAGLIGGGLYPVPGEISLSHNGVLFLDEINEFSSYVIDMLRQSLEAGYINISRKNGTTSYPADFMLIAAANPCKCGLLYEKKCECTPLEISKYKNKLSGAIMDRIDIKIEVSSAGVKVFNSDVKEEASEEIKKRIVSARNIQMERFKNDGIYSNSQMNNVLIKKYVSINDRIIYLLEKYEKARNLSLRGCISIFKLARTIADIDGNTNVSEDNILEALQLRMEV